jgi:hypothetical protein
MSFSLKKRAAEKRLRFRAAPDGYNPDVTHQCIRRDMTPTSPVNRASSLTSHSIDSGDIDGHVKHLGEFDG